MYRYPTYPYAPQPQPFQTIPTTLMALPRIMTADLGGHQSPQTSGIAAGPNTPAKPSTPPPAPSSSSATRQVATAAETKNDDTKNAIIKANKEDKSNKSEPAAVSPGTQMNGEGPAEEKKAGPSTYKHRNVYKSIIRHMYSCIRKQRNVIVSVLQSSGFSISEIEHAFYEIGCYNDMERQKGKKKISQSLVKKIASEKSIFAYVLRESLNSMLKNWEDGKFGRLTKKNVSTYKDVCTKYFNETVKVLGPPAQNTPPHL